MIDLAILPVFLAAIFVLVISPGPDLLLISTYSSSRGARAGIMISIGIFLSGLLQTLMVAFGLGQLMQALPAVAVAVKVIGALYLAWLGIQLLRSWGANNHDNTNSVESQTLSAMQLVQRGLLNNLLNPKALIFFSAFLPQFTSGTEALSGQILILGLILSCFALAINIVMSLFFGKVGKLFGQKLSLGRHTDALVGLLFLGLAARLASSR